MAQILDKLLIMIETAKWIVDCRIMFLYQIVIGSQLNSCIGNNIFVLYVC